MKKIQSALISVYYKEGLERTVRLLHEKKVTIYSTGGTQKFIEDLSIPCIPVEEVTTYPSILGGRVKTLHPSVFGGILGRRHLDSDLDEMNTYQIPSIDLVIVDLYPFEETVASTSDEALIIEKIDIGGPSMIRAAAKNHRDVVVVAAKHDYTMLEEILQQQDACTSLEQRRAFAIKAFDVCTRYDMAISNYFNGLSVSVPYGQEKRSLRYGENPHQSAAYYGSTDQLFVQLHGKELSYNNLVDVEAALQLMLDVGQSKQLSHLPFFAIIKHTNVCGCAIRETVFEAWTAALSCDPESAFGGVLVCNRVVDEKTATAISEIFFEVLIAPEFEAEALNILNRKKNRILLETQELSGLGRTQHRSLLNGLLVQDHDSGNYLEWKECGGRMSTEEERTQLEFANIICKHLKSNAIAIVKNNQLLGKGCGQTSRIDSLRQALEKSRQFNADVRGAVLASDAFFPFDDCVKMAHDAGLEAFVQPGGSIRDADSINYCKENKLVMVITGMRHFKH